MSVFLSNWRIYLQIKIRRIEKKHPPWMAAYASGNPGEPVTRAGTIPVEQNLRKVNPATNPGELVARAGAIPGKQDLHGCKSCDLLCCLFFIRGFNFVGEQFVLIMPFRN